MRITIFTLFLFASYGLFAQTDSTASKRQYGIAAHTFISRYSCGLGNSLVFTITRKKHQFEIGPKYIFNDSIKSIAASQIGAEFNYRYYPNGLSERFDLFFLLNVDTYHTKSGVFHQYTIPENYTKTINYFGLNAGFGTQTHLWSGFYLGSNIAGGLMLESHRTNSYSAYHHLKFGFLGEVSLGFRFK